MNPCGSLFCGCDGSCAARSSALPANGYCSLHGHWAGYGGCPSCSTAIIPLQTYTFPVYEPVEPLPLTEHRLVPVEKLKRFGELVDEIVALAAEIVPD